MDAGSEQGLLWGRHSRLLRLVDTLHINAVLQHYFDGKLQPVLLSAESRRIKIVL
jgi:hypothetical protein